MHMDTCCHDIIIMHIMHMKASVEGLAQLAQPHLQLLLNIHSFLSFLQTLNAAAAARSSLGASMSSVAQSSIACIRDCQAQVLGERRRGYYPKLGGKRDTAVRECSRFLLS